jgi:G3E family GTPase
MSIAPIPACLVTGLTGTDKRSFVAALLRARPAGNRWALLDNDGGGSALEFAQSGLETATVSGCACCTGQVALHAGIVQLVRRARPQWLVVAVDGAAEPDALERVFAQPELARGIRVAQKICAISPQWLVALPQNALERLQRQMTAADCVVTANAEAVATLRATGIERVVQADEAVRRIAGASAVPSASSPRIAS